MVLKRPRIRPWMLRKEILVLYYAFKDKRSTGLAKIPAILSVLYLLSPIDLIPDFIPFVGLVDDVVVVPLLLNLAIRLLPAETRAAGLQKAENNHRKLQVLFWLGVIVIMGLIIGIIFLIRHLIQHR